MCWDFFFLLQANIDLGAPAKVLDKGSSKRPQGRPANASHYHDNVGSESFLQIIYERTLGMLQIPSKCV
jgi:hypothetical protein